MGRGRREHDRAADLTVVAVPLYFATMGAEHLWLRRRARSRGPSPADYERRDTVTSLTMGVGSLLAPAVAQRLLGPLTPGRGRYGRALVAGALGAAALTTAADAVGRRSRRRAPAARRVASASSVAAVVAGGVAVTTAWGACTTPERLWARRVLPDLGSGALALALAVALWDFVYYWDHRFMHSSRYMWAVHVVHHSSERYNLSTALRQPVAEAFGTFLPFGALCLLGVRPSLVEWRGGSTCSTSTGSTPRPWAGSRVRPC
jgi:hypothetical protein